MSNGDSRFDWKQVRQRLNAAFADVEHDSEYSQAETRRILKARAKALADSGGSPEAAETIEIVEFLLASERYAVDTGYVREVYPLDKMTPLPGTPDFVRGIVNIRGEILSVVDIKRFFGLPKKEITHLDKVIVLESDSMVFGILVDHLFGVRLLPAQELQSSRKSSSAIDSNYVQGITASGLAVLDAGVLLADEKIIVQEQ